MQNKLLNFQSAKIKYLKLERDSWQKLLAILIGLATTLWFIIRVIPKPIRITYPCQRSAFPVLTGFIVWLSGVHLPIVTMKIKKNIIISVYKTLMITGVFSIAIFIIYGFSSNNLFSNMPAPSSKVWVPKDSANSPIGVGKGIFPGRVVWVRDTTATPYDGITGHWWDDNSTKQDVVDTMISKCICNLSGTTDDKKAWDKIFSFYNTTHNRGNKGYQPGEMIAIKINCNNAYEGYIDSDNQIDASKQTVLGLIRQLVNNAGVPQDKIIFYEAIRVIPDRIYKPCHQEFPGVLWMDSKGNNDNGRLPVVWRENTIKYSGVTKCGTSIPQKVYEAVYLINMSLMKGHISMGISLTAKNHYGSINAQDHPWYNPGVYHPFVDLIGSKDLGGKTILYIMDGLYGIRDVNDNVGKEFAAWNNLFKGQWLSSIFMSQDPVAIDAVGYDFLRSEFGERLGRSSGAPADTYMHEAALANNPPSGTVYKPDGVRLSSLGVHEHWNNPVKKQYSRNLSPNGKGIELVQIHK